MVGVPAAGLLIFLSGRRPTTAFASVRDVLGIWPIRTPSSLTVSYLSSELHQACMVTGQGKHGFLTQRSLIS